MSGDADLLPDVKVGPAGSRAVLHGMTWGMEIQREGNGWADRAVAERKEGRSVIHLERVTAGGLVVVVVEVGVNGARQMFELRPGDEFYVEVPPA